MRKHRAPLVAAVLALAMTGCGIPVTGQASSVPPHQVPFHLLSPTVPTSTTTTVPAAAFVAERIYLVNPNGILLPAARDVAVPAPLGAVLEALLAGPSRAETAAGITSAIPPGVKVLSLSVTGGTATLNLNQAFGAISPTSETQAVAQLVLTTTGQADIAAVSFAIDGQPIAVPTASGASTKSPVTAASYSALLRTP
jgi:hypothetical protein